MARKQTASHKEPPRPIRIDVLGTPWLVVWDDEEDWVHRKYHSKDESKAYTDNIENTTYMRTFAGRTDGDPASVSAMQVILTHELMHIVMYIGGITNQLGDIKDKHDDVEEWLAENLAPPMLAVLRSNPGLLEWLTWSEF